MCSITLQFRKSTRVIRRKTIQVPALSLAVLLLSLPVFPQLNLGRIFGGVTDQSGGAIVGATVTVVDVERHISRPLTTDSAGQYSAPSLIPGTYTVRAEFTGFKTVERTDIVVGVGEDIRVDVSMQPGEQSQTVVVTGEAPMINTTNASLGGTLENQTINELPLNGRQYKNLLAFKPGMTANPGTGNNKSFSSNGNRAEMTVYMFDGLYNNNVFSGMPIVGGSTSGGGIDQATILPVDAIQEVNIIENPKAEYGWRPGGQVNVGLKSGTNSVHGTAFAFGRSTSMDARNYFLPATLPKAPVDFEQFGASIGGPIKKNKIFFFGTYEGQRLTVGAPAIVSIPTAVPGAGSANSFPDAIKDLLSKGLHPTQLSLNLAGCTLAGTAVSCNPTNGLFPNSGTSSNSPIDLNTDGGSNNTLVKVDYHLNEHNAFNGEYFFGQSTFDFSRQAIEPWWRTWLYARAQVLRAVWIWTPNSNLVNEARFGYDNTTLPNDNEECVQPNSGSPNYQTQFGFVSGTQYCGFSILTISGFAALGGSTNPQANNFGTLAGSDSVSYTHGKHLFKFGGEIHATTWCCSQRSSSTGTINFGSVNAFTSLGVSGTATALEDFLLGVPGAGTQVLVGNPNRTITFKQYALFVQDDWRLTSRLTVNLGLRWEYESPIKEKNNLLGNFDPTAPAGLVQQTSSNTVYKGDPKDFAPRLGLAWDVTGKGITVVRAGGGIVFNYCCNLQTLLGLGGTMASLNAVPTGFKLVAANGTTLASPGTINVGLVAPSGNQFSWNAGTPVFNTGTSALACGNGLGSANAGAATGASNPQNPSACNIGVINPDMHRGYVTTWTLGVQHAFSSSLTLDVAYVGDHGTKLNSASDLNVPALGPKNSSSNPPGSGIEQLRRPYYSQFPYIGKIIYWTDNEDSNYNGLQASLVQRAFHGMTFTAGYTFAHALDDGSVEGGNALMNVANSRSDYGASGYDVRHDFTLAATYVVPGKKSPAELLQGWELNFAVNIMSAFPYVAIDTADDISGTGRLLDRWTLVGSAKDFSNIGVPIGATAGAIPCYGISTSTFGKTVGCSTAVPAACTAAAAAEPTGPGGTTGTAMLSTIGCYMEGNAVIVPPAQGTYGSMGRNVLRGPGAQLFDMSVSKNWKLKEKLTVQFRVEAFNVLNHPQFAPGSEVGNIITNPSISSPATFGQSATTPDSGNGVIGTGGPREIQLGMKLIF